MPVTIDQVQQATDVIAGHIIDTPCLHSRTLSRIFGAQVFLKFENPVGVEFVLQTRSHDHVRQVIEARAARKDSRRRFIRTRDIAPANRGARWIRRLPRQPAQRIDVTGHVASGFGASVENGITEPARVQQRGG